MKKLQSAQVKKYGDFLTVTLSKKSKPGDGKFGRGKKG
ncbi:lariocidin family lasso peptide [Lysinibacillus sp. FSL W8-0992]